MSETETNDRYERSRARREMMMWSMCINPNPHLVRLMNFAIEHITPKLCNAPEYQSWLAWSRDWAAGERTPQRCVEVGREYLNQREHLICHTLGQIAWAGKEACYSTPQSGWLVIRYIADAMTAFGIAFPVDADISLGLQALKERAVLDNDGRLIPQTGL